MKYLPAILYHMLPILPLAFGLNYLAIAVACLVGLAYVKVHKLKSVEVENTKRRIQDPGLSRVIAFWERLTFLPRTKSDEEA